MNIENMKKYVEWAKVNLRQKKLDMSDYTNGDDFSKEPEIVCGTSACFLGWSLLCFRKEFKQHIKKHIKVIWFRLSNDLFGINSCSHYWDWCFDQCWPNDLDQAIARMQWLIDGNEPVYGTFEIDYNWRG